MTERKADQAKQHVFVYGTLKRGFRNNVLLEGYDVVQEAVTTPKYRMFDCGSYPGLVKDENGYEVHGEIYLVDNKTMEQLDHLEGTPFLYQRGEIKLANFDKPTIAYFYQRSTSRLPDCGGKWEGSKRW